jgi:serine/threonine protein kinase
MPLNPGQILNKRYRIIRQLGQGGFATIYRAEDLSTKSVCALKENLDYWDESQRQFEREAQILAGLHHPNLPHVFDYFFQPAMGQFLVMDYVEGYDLQDVLDRIKQPLVEKKVMEWIGQICDALVYLHTQTPSIIHRDIKPANIKVTPTNRAMLVDFGVAKVYDPVKRTTMAARAVTPGYSPVEQYGHGTTDARTDQYALAATLYHLLTGTRPPESIERVTGAVLEQPCKLNSSISPHVEAAILRGMQVIAGDRFATTAEFKDALDHPIAPEVSKRSRVSKPASKHILQAAQISLGNIPAPAAESASRSTSARRDHHAHKTVIYMEWVVIPAGEFLFSEELKKVFLPDFEIARFPVTNQQYHDFLIANPGHPAPESWKSREYPLGKGEHPVVGVSYQDAIAFCQWFGCRLPNEEEWEKAARGIDGRSFPWGEDWQEGLYCNNYDTRIGGTSPVDKFSAGRSPYEIWDMAGNVWEWTSSEAQGGPFIHVMRGGSWRLFSKYAVQATARSMLLSEEKRDDLGFRCAR